MKVPIRLLSKHFLINNKDYWQEVNKYFERDWGMIQPTPWLRDWNSTQWILQHWLKYHRVSNIKTRLSSKTCISFEVSINS